MFTIAEELLLLALHDDKGTVIFSAGGSLDYGLAGAILAELTIQERIELEGKKVVVTDETPTENPILDTILNKMTEAKKPKSVNHWIQNLPMRQMRKDMLHQLAEKGVLQEKEEKILWVFTQKAFPTEQEGPEHQIRERVHASVFGNEKPDARTAMLLSLIKACNLVDEVFSKKDKKEAKKRIDQISKNNDYGQAVKASVEAMQTAVIVACTAIAASSAAGSDGGGG